MLSKASDVWSFAMLVIEVSFHILISNTSLICICFTKVLTNCQPWGKRRNIFVIMEGVAAGKRPERPSTHECNDALWSLISRCWDFDPAQRPDITQVCTSVHQPEINNSSGMYINLSIILAVRMNIIYSSRINHCFLSY